jgi:hypothetical protein
MKIIFESYGIKHSAKLDEGATTTELVKIITAMLEYMNYQPESIKKAYENELQRLNN